MKIAVDKYSYQVAKNDGNEYIYIQDDENLSELMATKLPCKEWYEVGPVDINTTDWQLDCNKRCKITEKDWIVPNPYKEYKIGIIVPNFNYEHTIKKCLESILNQTYKNFEIILVDDMSTDNSIKIAEETYQKYLVDSYGYYDDTCTEEKMKIVQLKQKRLNGGARNEGYLHLDDDVDYVYYIDSDDWLYDENCLKKINDRLQSKPDVLFVALASYKDNKTQICCIPTYQNKYQAIQGWSGSCGKVIKKELATRQECLYNEGTLKEDRNQHRKICIYMETFQLLKDPIYVWNQTNAKSVTSVRCLNPVWETSTIRQYADTLELYLREKGKDPNIDLILKEALNKCLNEIKEGGDKQW
jgi:glycosyltransferase involved in cell wall biosynthesis